MDLSTFIVAVFCIIDDRLKDRGPHLRSTLSERLCSRQIWEGRFSPVAACRQH
jgi:hypothetical protein